MISFIEALQANNYNIIGGLHGVCKYVDKREIVSTIEQKDIDKINIKDKTMNFNALFELGAKIANNDIYFIKMNNYAEEHEYRMIWNTNNKNIPTCAWEMCKSLAIDFCFISKYIIMNFVKIVFCFTT